MGDALELVGLDHLVVVVERLQHDGVPDRPQRHQVLLRAQHHAGDGDHPRLLHGLHEQGVGVVGFQAEQADL